MMAEVEASFIQRSCGHRCSGYSYKGSTIQQTQEKCCRCSEQEGSLPVGEPWCGTCQLEETWEATKIEKG